MVSGVILAAGESRRLAGDRPKQLLDFEGQPLVRRIAERALAARLLEVVVVVGHHADEVLGALGGLAVRTVHNPDYREGQSTSMKTGLRSVDARASAALFMPCDQPHLSTAVIDRLVAAYEMTGSPIVLPTFGGRRGAPVLFDRALFPELRGIDGDVGGRAVLPRHAGEIVEVALESEEPLLDVDTLADAGNAAS